MMMCFHSNCICQWTGSGLYGQGGYKFSGGNDLKVIDATFDNEFSFVEISNNSGAWELYDLKDFKGDCVRVGPGRTNLTGSTNFNDRVSSIRRSFGNPNCHAVSGVK
jgi:hypothetical protein